MARDARLQRIIRPAVNGDRTVHIDDMTKTQLAVALNERSARFKAQGVQLQAAMRVLLAMVLEPESFHHTGATSGYVEMAAIEKVKAGMTLRIDEEGDQMRVRIDQEEHVIVTPRIAGVN